MVKRGTVYVPTVDHNRYYVAHKDEFGYDQAAVDRLNAYILKNFETLRRAVRLHVRIAMGSDAVFTGFGENTLELGWFVKAGMTSAQALDAATIVGAELLGKVKGTGCRHPRRLCGFSSDRRGSVEGHHRGSQRPLGHEGRRGGRGQDQHCNFQSVAVRQMIRRIYLRDE